jgi:acyl carrier protein
MNDQTSGGAAVDSERIRRWITVYLAVITGQASEEIQLDQKLASFDLDSVDAVELTSEFEKVFGRELDPERFLNGSQTLREALAGLT